MDRRPHRSQAVDATCDARVPYNGDGVGEHLTRGARRMDTIVEAVLAMSRAMSVSTIAEGVETLAQADALIQRGCNQAQGYLYGRAMPLAAFTELLRESVRVA